jgi:hypothetical protein
MFGKYNGFVSKARVSACMYFLVYTKKLLALINPFDFDVCELGPQCTEHRWKEREKLHNIVEIGNN